MSPSELSYAFSHFSSELLNFSLKQNKTKHNENIFLWLFRLLSLVTALKTFNILAVYCPVCTPSSWPFPWTMVCFLSFFGFISISSIYFYLFCILTSGLLYFINQIALNKYLIQVQSFLPVVQYPWANYSFVYFLIIFEIIA